MSASPQASRNPSNSFSNRRCSSLIFSSDIFTFQPEINSYSHRLTIQTHSNIHERLYQEIKLKKRSDSNRVLQIPKKIIQLKKNNLYEDSQIQKAQNRKKCLIMRRNISQDQDKELKFTPSITKYNFSAPRRAMPLEQYLMMSEQYKKSYRYKLIRKHNKPK